MIILRVLTRVQGPLPRAFAAVLRRFSVFLVRFDCILYLFEGWFLSSILGRFGDQFTLHSIVHFARHVTLLSASLHPGLALIVLLGCATFVRNEDHLSALNVVGASLLLLYWFHFHVLACVFKCANW